MAETVLAHTIVARARMIGARIAVAESLSGGLVTDAIVSVPGASSVFSGGIVAYDTELKHTLLGVEAALLREAGPVDERVAQQMARGVRSACAVDGNPALVGVATTGVAGPDADWATGQPPGTVWIGVSSPASERAELFMFEGDRAAIREATVAAALAMLSEELGRLAS
ncbi:CinA family protein [Leucobacter sp. HY1908]